MTRRLLGAVAVVSLLALALSPLATPTVSAETATPTVTVSPTSDVTDGQPITVNIKAPSSISVIRAVAQQCRMGAAGTDYQSSTSVLPAADFNQDGPNCPGTSHKLSSSSDTSVSDTNTSTNASTPDGESFAYKAGVGTATWTDNNSGTDVSLTCDDSHPCALVVEVRYKSGSSPSTWLPFVSQLQFRTNDPIAACGGPADGIVNSGASDRMLSPWISWTLAACRRPGAAHGAPTRTSFVGEGSAVTQFAQGTLDLAYTAGGYDKDMATGSKPDSGLTASDLTQRPAVAVPIAINAAIVGVYGGIEDSGHRVPFHDIKLTYDEAAAMFSGGPRAVDPYLSAIDQRNEELTQEIFDPSAGLIPPVAAYPDAEASSWYATRLFKLLAPNAWKVPDLPSYGDARGKSRGIDAALALAEPSFALSISLQSGEPPLQKALSFASAPGTQGGVWILTDLSVANDLHLSPVKLSPTEGNFIAPTPASLIAALPSMKADDQGILVSDPTKTPGGAYPMTFVEYALAPAEPLMGTDCTPRANSEALLKDWLTYITGDGQAKLPGGLVPLTADLKTQAADAIKKVGASPVSGTCATSAGASTAAPSAPGAAPPPDLPIPPPSAAFPGSSVGAPVSGIGSGNFPAVDAGVASPASALGAGDTAGGDGSQSDLNARQVAAVPPFAGRSSPSGFFTAFALLGVIALSTLALFATTKHR